MIARRVLAVLAIAGCGAALSVAPAQAAPASPATAALPASAVSAPAPKGPSADTSAAIYGTFTNHTTVNYVNIRLCPGTSCGASGQAQKSHSLTDYCYVVGQTINGNPFWDSVLDRNTGKRGWVSEYYLVDKSQTKYC